MLATEKRNTNLGIGGGIVLFIAGHIVIEATAQNAAVAVLGLLAVVAGYVLFIWGCVSYARGKGYNGAWGLLGLLSILGLIVLFFFPDRYLAPFAGPAAEPARFPRASRSAMTPHMPEVDLGPDIEACFAQARQLSAGAIDVPGEGSGQRCVAVITPGRLTMPIPCPPAEAVSEEMLADIRHIVPPHPKLAITVIAFNDVVMQGALNAGQVSSLIPFLGYLMGMAFDGHTVVVFEGHPSALKVGCHDADVLIVDQRMAEHLQEDWVMVASAAMRTSRILVFGRDGSIAAVDPRNNTDNRSAV